jgi:hypothetical protein
MSKSKITVTVDAELVAAVRDLGTASLSSVVNTALAAEVERRARAATLDRLLAEWDAAFGSVPPEATAAARAAFDDADAVTDAGPGARAVGAA